MLPGFGISVFCCFQDPVRFPFRQGCRLRVVSRFCRLQRLWGLGFRVLSPQRTLVVVVAVVVMMMIMMMTTTRRRR